MVIHVTDITVNQLNVHFDKAHALKDVSMRIEERR